MLGAKPPAHILIGIFEQVTKKGLIAMDDALTYERLLERRNSTLDGWLGIEIIEIDEQGVVLTMPVSEKIHQPSGVVHGGIYLVLAESAAGIHASYITDMSKNFPMGIENNASHLRSVSEGTLRADARLVRRSRSLAVHTVEIQHLESEEILSTARVTSYYKAVK